MPYHPTEKEQRKKRKHAKKTTLGESPDEGEERVGGGGALARVLRKKQKMSGVRKGERKGFKALSSLP